MPTADPTKPDPAPLRPHQLTWAALLGRWMEFAKSALALPQDATGDALRQSVPDIIMLQAVTCALRDLGDLSADERALGLDRAELLIEKHAEALARRWGAGVDPVPSQVTDLIDDAHTQLAAAQAPRS